MKTDDNGSLAHVWMPSGAAVRARLDRKATARCTLAKMLLVAAVMFPLSLATFCQAERYVKISAEMEVIGGDIVMSQSNSSGATPLATNEGRWTISFVCITGTNQWQLDGDFVVGAREKWFYDGTNVYHSLQPAMPPSDNLTVNIAVTPGGYPLADVGVSIPWLAFCSGTFLKRNGRIVPLPTHFGGHAPDAFAYSDKTQTFDDTLGLPRSVELLTSESLYESSVRQHRASLFIDKNAQNSPVPKSGFRDGLRKFHYSVTLSTNFLGWNFPLAFEFAEEIPEEFGRVLRTHRGSGKVTAICLASKPDGVFNPSMKQTIVDWRFRHDVKAVNALVYRSTKAFALPTNDPVLQAEFAAKVKRAPRLPAIRTRQARLMIGLLLFLAAALPLTWLLVKKVRKHQTN